MAISTQEGPLIAKGYPYTVQIEADKPMFSASHTYKAHVRVKPDATTVLAELTTGNGISFVSETSVDITIPATATASFPLGEVWIDMVRTDVTPNLFMGWQMALPVLLPVTRS